MRKVIGLFLVIAICSVSAFAQNRENRRDRDRDPGKHWAKMAEDLKLDEKQTAEFNKINEEFMQKMKDERTGSEAEREAMKAAREKKMESMKAIMSERDAKMKEILTDEQYQAYLEKQKPPRDRNKRFPK